MAKENANEQVKEVLRQIIKHRFWISIGFAALFAVIAYLVGSGPVNKAAADERKKITDAEKGVQAYQSSSKPTEKYKPIVVEKTEIVEKDVNKAWRGLYKRQEPLLTWPARVEERFRKWGRKWPETEDSGRVRVAIVDYIYAYPQYVDMVYKTFEPFDYETGKGIVAAPSKEELLQPSQFSVESMPSLGKVWAAQERLWIQRTVLEVIHQVNKKSKDWDSAIVKQVNVLLVASQAAQDQKSIARGDQLTKAADILAPGEQSAEDAAAAGGAGAAAAMPAGMNGPGGASSRMMEMMGGRPGGMGGSGGMGGGGVAAQTDDSIYYIEKGKSKILPVSITVLIDEDHVADLLCELENSPMSIQVMDIDLEKPSARVKKPEKGEQPAGMGGMGMAGMMGMMMGRRGGQGMAGMGGLGGQASMMRNQMMTRMMGGGGMRGGMGMGMAGMGRGAGGMGMPGGMGTSTSSRQDRTKVDTSSVKRKEEREKKTKELEERKGLTLFDPYFNIVELTVYGQARFFEAPPEEPPAEPSLGGAPAAADAPAAGATPTTAPAAPAAAAKSAAEKAAAPAGKAAASAGEKGAAPAAGADAKSAKSQPGAETAPAKPAGETRPAAAPAPADQPAAATKGAAASP